MGDAMNMMKIYSHDQSACAAAPMYTQESEQEESSWVHEVKKAPTADEVSVSAVDKLTDVVEKLLDVVERLSNSFGSSCVDSFVWQPGQPFRNEDYAEYSVEGPYPRKVRNRWYNGQHAYERGSGPNAYDGSAGNWRNNRYHGAYQNSNFRSEDPSEGDGPWVERRDISCLKCGGVGHIQRMCLESTKPVSKNNEVLSLEWGGPQHAKDVHDAVPLVLPTVPDVVSDPRMVIGESTEGDHGDSVCMDAFRIQRVAVQSAEAASREAARKLAFNRADQVAAEVAQGEAIRQAVGEMAKPATGDKAKPTAGPTSGTERLVVISPRQTVGAGRPVMALHRKTAGIDAVDLRGGGAFGYRVAPDKKREDEFRRSVRRGLRGWRPSSSRRWERSRQQKTGRRPTSRRVSLEDDEDVLCYPDEHSSRCQLMVVAVVVVGGKAVGDDDCYYDKDCNADTDNSDDDNVYDVYDSCEEDDSDGKDGEDDEDDDNYDGDCVMMMRMMIDADVGVDKNEDL
ncbi:hypothetical protein DPMN_004372 [Dreissena polymorpha]|uniref:CCHC-type domain-containing protein n=1 Tax=Dreissena polymorpha TaxID=45954 RepID=A0A9D4MNG0_DREPO|nr:hypothetical protein DPMN_004372 [Dreissena polymorpha]